MLAGSALADAFFEAVNEGVAPDFDVVFDIEDPLALGALRFLQVADLGLEGVLLVNGGGEARLAVQGFDLRLGVGQFLFGGQDHVVGPALQALALLLEDFAVGFKGAGNGGFGVAFGLLLQAVGRRGLGRGGLDSGVTTEKLFARFLIEGVALVGSRGEKQVFLALKVLKVGNIDSIPVTPAEILADMPSGAMQLIVSHNHPSGDPTPSPSDRQVHRDMKDAVSLFLGEPIVPCGRGGAEGGKIKQVLDWALRHIRGTVRNTATGFDISIARTGLEKATSASAIGKSSSLEAHLEAVRQLPALLAKASLEEARPARKGTETIANNGRRPAAPAAGGGFREIGLPRRGPGIAGSP